MMALHGKALACFFLSLIIFAGAAFADTIYLNNGGKIKGKVIREAEDTVTIDIGGGTVVQNRADIVRIKTEADVLQPKESKALKAAEEKSATPMFDTKKTKKGVLGIVGGIVDTAFSILKFDFLKKDK